MVYPCCCKLCHYCLVLSWTFLCWFTLTFPDSFCPSLLGKSFFSFQIAVLNDLSAQLHPLHFPPLWKYHPKHNFNYHLNSNDPQIYIYSSDVSLMLSTYIIFNINPEHTISILYLMYIEIIIREGNGTPLQYSCLENPWTEEPGRLQAMGSLRVGNDWATSLSLFTFMHWRRKWQPTPVFLPGESQGQGNLVISDTTEVT